MTVDFVQYRSNRVLGQGDELAVCNFEDVRHREALASRQCFGVEVSLVLQRLTRVLGQGYELVVCDFEEVRRSFARRKV